VAALLLPGVLIGVGAGCGGLEGCRAIRGAPPEQAGVLAPTIGLESLLRWSRPVSIESRPDPQTCQKACHRFLAKPASDSRVLRDGLSWPAACLPGRRGKLSCHGGARRRLQVTAAVAALAAHLELQPHGSPETMQECLPVGRQGPQRGWGCSDRGAPLRAAGTGLRRALGARPLRTEGAPTCSTTATDVGARGVQPGAFVAAAGRGVRAIPAARKWAAALRRGSACSRGAGCAVCRPVTSPASGAGGGACSSRCGTWRSSCARRRRDTWGAAHVPSQPLLAGEWLRAHALLHSNHDSLAAGREAPAAMHAAEDSWHQVTAAPQLDDHFFFVRHLLILISIQTATGRHTIASKCTQTCLLSVHGKVASTSWDCHSVHPTKRKGSQEVWARVMQAAPRCPRTRTRCCRPPQRW